MIAHKVEHDTLFILDMTAVWVPKGETPEYGLQHSNIDSEKYRLAKCILVNWASERKGVFWRHKITVQEEEPDTGALEEHEYQIGMSKNCNYSQAMRLRKFLFQAEENNKELLAARAQIDDLRLQLASRSASRVKEYLVLREVDKLPVWKRIWHAITGDVTSAMLGDY